MVSKRVLLVEDSALIHKLVRATLRNYPREIEVYVANDGVEGLVMLNQHPDTDLILLDVNMPNMSGLEFLSTVRKEPVFDDVKVVLQSTEDRQADIERGLAAGASGYLTKPFTAAELHALLDEMFEDPSPMPQPSK